MVISTASGVRVRSKGPWGQPEQRSRRWTGLALLFVATQLLSGCSLLFMTSPPPGHEWKSNLHADCTSSKAAPAIDLVLTGTEVLGTALVAGDSGLDDEAQTAGIVAGILATIVKGVSAAYGFTQASRCADYKAFSARRRWDREAALHRKPKRQGVPLAAPPVPQAPAVPPTPEDAAPVECEYDLQCKSPRFCSRGRCIIQEWNK